MYIQIHRIIRCTRTIFIDILIDDVTILEESRLMQIPLRLRHVRVWYVGDRVTLQIVRLQINEIWLLHRLKVRHAVVVSGGRIHFIQNDFGLLLAIWCDYFEVAGIEIGIVAQ